MNARGFTLFHVIVTTLFLSVVLSAGFPLMYSYMQFARLQGASSAMTTALVRARINAVEHYRPVILCSSQDGINCDGVGHWEKGFIAFIDADRNGRRSGGERPHLIQAPLDNGATIRSDFSNSHRVVYLPSGRVQHTDKFNICISAATAMGRTIDLNLTGRPHPKKGANDCPGGEPENVSPQFALR